MPSIVRSDHGTENTTLAACHMALRHEHNDEFNGERSFRFGASTTNTVELNLKFMCANSKCSYWEHSFTYSHGYIWRQINTCTGCIDVIRIHTKCLLILLHSSPMSD